MSKNRRVALALIALLYVIAWLSPLAKGGTTLAKGGLPGWEGLKLALSPLWDPESRESWWQATLAVISGITNLWFVVAIVWLWRTDAAPRRMIVWTTLLALLINAHWMLTFEPLSDLRIGYYLWLLAFAALAGVAVRQERRPADVVQ